jgi:hypothetical protein
MIVNDYDWICVVGKILPPRAFERAQQLLGAVLNFIAGFFHVLAEAVGRVAAYADDGQKRGETEEDNDAFE